MLVEFFLSWLDHGRSKAAESRKQWTGVIMKSDTCVCLTPIGILSTFSVSSPAHKINLYLSSSHPLIVLSIEQWPFSICCRLRQPSTWREAPMICNTRVEKRQNYCVFELLLHSNRPQKRKNSTLIKQETPHPTPHTQFGSYASFSWQNGKRIFGVWGHSLDLCCSTL